MRYRVKVAQGLAFVSRIPGLSLIAHAAARPAEDPTPEPSQAYHEALDAVQEMEPPEAN